MSLQNTVDRQFKEIVKLKGKVKKYAEKMAGMEVLVAEAAVIVKEYHFSSKDGPLTASSAPIKVESKSSKK